MGSSLGSLLCPLTVSLHTLHALLCEQLAPANHEDMGDGTEDVETGYASHLTIFSADSEYSSNTSSEAPESLCNGLRGESNRGTLEPHRGLSPLVFDLRRALASTISFTGDPEVPTTRRVGSEEESEPRSNRLALYRTSYLDFGERHF